MSKRKELKQIRIAMIGPKGSGKTSLAKALVPKPGQFDEKEKTTLGIGQNIFSTKEAKAARPAIKRLRQQFNFDLTEVREVAGDERFQKVADATIGPKAKPPIDAVMLLVDLSRSDKIMIEELQSWID